MPSMLKRHEVEILLKAGHGKAEVARLTGVSLCSVKRIAQEGPVVHVDDAAERAQRQVVRPSTVANFRKPILEILRRVREAGYEGGKTALYAQVASLRPKSAKPLVRFEGLPGDFSQHDFGEIEVEFVSGTRRRIHFFASRLKYSRLMRVSLVRDEAVESLVRTLAEHRVFSVRLRELRGQCVHTFRFGSHSEVGGVPRCLPPCLRVEARLLESGKRRVANSMQLWDDSYRLPIERRNGPKI
jgi:transposase